MIEWRDEAVVLASRPHGETDVVVTLATFEHGRHLGLVKGGAGRRTRALLEPGNRVEAVWRARLESHLGTVVLEPVRLYAATILDDPLRLAAVASVCAVLDVALPEREPQPRVYAALVAFLGRIAAESDWPATYVRLELLLLAEMGFALQLETCAVTGRTDDLAYVSPRTGRAVGREAAGAYAARLLPLPPFLVEGETPAEAGDVAAGLRLAGHFLGRHILDPADRPMPLARERLTQLWQARAEETSP